MSVLAGIRVCVCARVHEHDHECMGGQSERGQYHHGSGREGKVAD